MIRVVGRVPACAHAQGRAAWLALFLISTGCVLTPVDLASKECPCTDGWTCDTRVGRCVLGTPGDGQGTIRPDSNPPKASPDAGSEPDDGDHERLDAGAVGMDADIPLLDAAPADAAPADAAPADAAPADAAPVDAAPADAAPADAAPADAATQDGAAPAASMHFPASACVSSIMDSKSCTLITDGSEGTSWAHQCAQGDGVCSFDGACSTSGCVSDLWWSFDLGAARTISRVRFLSDWWSKRPKTYEIWASDSPSDVPFAGASRVATAVGHANPWRCVAGESCLDPDVPDTCCPNGRDAPQAPPTTFNGKYDIHDFSAHAARYWYLVVRDTYVGDVLTLHEVTYWGPP